MKRVLIPIVKFIKVRLPSIIMGRITMNLHRPGNSTRSTPAITLENGSNLLLENGGRILLERKGTKMFPARPPVLCPVFRLENGCRLLQENGFKINIENNN